MSPSAVPSGRTICQSALAPGISVPLSWGPANVPPVSGTMRLRPWAVSPTSSGSPSVASSRPTRVSRGLGSSVPDAVTAAGSFGWGASSVTVTCNQSARGNAASRPSSSPGLSAR